MRSGLLRAGVLLVLISSCVAVSMEKRLHHGHHKRHRERQHHNVEETAHVELSERGREHEGAATKAYALKFECANDGLTANTFPTNGGDKTSNKICKASPNLGLLGMHHSIVHQFGPGNAQQRQHTGHCWELDPVVDEAAFKAAGCAPFSDKIALIKPIYDRFMGMFSLENTQDPTKSGHPLLKKAALYREMSGDCAALVTASGATPQAREAFVLGKMSQDLVNNRRAKVIGMLLTQIAADNLNSDRLYFDVFDDWAQRAQMEGDDIPIRTSSTIEECFKLEYEWTLWGIIHSMATESGVAAFPTMQESGIRFCPGCSVPPNNDPWGDLMLTADLQPSDALHLAFKCLPAFLGQVGFNFGLLNDDSYYACEHSSETINVRPACGRLAIANLLNWNRQDDNKPFELLVAKGIKKYLALKLNPREEEKIKQCTKDTSSGPNNPRAANCQAFSTCYSSMLARVKRDIADC